MDAALKELIQISNKVGFDNSLVIGNYGNTSVKTADGKYMFIKASGIRLGDVNAQQGWRRVRVQPVLELLSDKSIKTATAAARSHKIDAGLICACEDQQPICVRPSIETFFHAMLGKVVIHLHPECILSVACAKNGEAEMKKIFAGEKYPPLWIPYAGLGYTSALKIKTLTSKYENEYGQKPMIMVIENHGLLVSAQSTASAMRLVIKAVNA